MTPKIVAISPNDTAKVVTVANFSMQEPERILSVPSNSDLYVAKWADGTVLRVPAANLSRYARSLLVITEADIFPTGTITVLTAVGGNLNVTRIYEETHPHFEAASFVPTNSSSGSASGLGPPVWGPSSEQALVVVAVVVAVAVVAFAIRRNRGT